MVAAFQQLARSRPRIAWMNVGDLAQAKSLYEVAALFRWPLEPGIGPHAIGIDFDGEKIGDDELFFGIIAPHVAVGSYIEMVGEDGDRWRWVFDGERVKSISPKVIWE